MRKHQVPTRTRQTTSGKGGLVSTILREIRIGKWAILVGMLAGLLVWLYDYGFFLNAGGSAAPISTEIIKICHLENANSAIIILFPLCVLMITGVAVALSIASFIRRLG
jgi:hypothetical protein